MQPYGLLFYRGPYQFCYLESSTPLLSSIIYLLHISLYDQICIRMHAMRERDKTNLKKGLMILTRSDENEGSSKKVRYVGVEVVQAK